MNVRHIIFEKKLHNSHILMTNHFFKLTACLCLLISGVKAERQFVMV